MLCWNESPGLDPANSAPDKSRVAGRHFWIGTGSHSDEAAARLGVTRQVPEPSTTSEWRGDRVWTPEYPAADGPIGSP